MIYEKRTGKDLEGSVRALIDVISRNLPGRADENHETRHPGYPVSRQRFEPSTVHFILSIVRTPDLTT
jgi:hypothetical protein